MRISTLSDFLRPPDNKEENTAFLQELCRVVNKRKVSVPVDSVAADVGALKTDFNALLAALRTAFE